MVCPKCAGASTQCKPVGHEWGVYEVGPCPECQGSGIVSCCDTAGASMTEEALLAGMREIREIFQENTAMLARRRKELEELAKLDADLL